MAAAVADEGVGLEFDPVIHSPVRLKVMMYLLNTPTASFNEMRKAANVTDGNLATHLKSLEGAGYVEASRGIVNLKPRMRYALTPEGRAALARYHAALMEAARRLEALMGGAPLEAGPGEGA